MPNILLVEDDDALSEGIALALRAQGTVRRCPTLAEAREALGRAGTAAGLPCCASARPATARRCWC